MAAKVTTPWGGATVVDEVDVAQRAGAKEFASVVQLLAGPEGERYVRFAYTTDGTARRGPVTLRAEDVARLREALTEHPELTAALRLSGAAATKAGGRPAGRR
ncbi:MAG TPA: hypothetical protein VHF67_04865 [Gaiellaceae bacterium]|nr:hypothetical protein [Gaiellaceae bacterium]